MRLISRILFTLFFMLSVVKMSAQLQLNDRDYFTFSVVADPVSSFEHHGLKIGAEIETVGAIYVRASLTNLASLESGYTEFVGAGGPSFTFGALQQFRFYAGPRLGFSYRTGSSPGAIFGAETGFDFPLGDKFFFGIRGTYEYKCDGDFYEDSKLSTFYSYARIGIKF